VEHGFYICEDEENGFEVGEVCSGEERLCELRGCREGQPKIGSVHTHPSGMILPTPEDVAHSFGHGERFFCIANPKGMTRCWKIAKWNDKLQELLQITLYNTADPDWKRQYDGGSLLMEDLIKKKGKILKQIAEFEV
jgi:hypothetical protein